MKRFHYRLETLLTLRRRAEQIALEAYAKSLLPREKARLKLRQSETRYAQAMDETRTYLNRSTTIAKIICAHQSVEAARRFRHCCQAELNQAEQRVKQAQKHMLDQRREREAVEIHYQNAARRFERERLREEQKELDEMVSQRYAWRHVDQSR